MGRSNGYCFKIIACGGTSESVDRDDLDASSQDKVTTDKRGWSFRKKSGGHRVLNNTVITEVLSSEDKKNSEPVVIKSEAVIDEKTTTNQWIETEEFSRVSTSNTRESNLVQKDADEDDVKADSRFDESSVIVIQTAVRKFLAEREVLRVKKVVKLQAVVRGHLTRCHAAGALRCIQAIVKMQTLVRARNANISLKRFSIKQKGTQGSKTQPHPTYISIEKLLSNKFANQLMESTPRSKQINIKCDPSEQDPTWQWLQRWTSLSSPEVKVNQPTPLTLTTGPTLPETTTTEAEPPKLPAKITATDQSIFGSKKPTNPSFISAQSKFLQLTSEPLADLAPQTGYESLKVGPTATSECGTELSVTSLLDSPDPSESGTIEPKFTESTRSIEDHHLLGTELTHSITFDTSQMTKSPPEASPRSQISSQQTPPSQLSNSTKSQTTREKPKGMSNSKKLSPISRGSLENLENDKNGKRRNLFGSQSSEVEVVVQEGRESSNSISSNSNCIIPSYMQVTESARAKALNNSSPRLSPDVIKGKDKEAYVKKRHSMPGAVNGGRHGSPRLKRSSPQSQQSSKGSDNRERKWQN